MLYRRFGKTELQLSVFSFGSMRLVNLDPAVATATVEAALAAGINHIETAQAYGDAELLLGRILSATSIPRSQLVITSKISPQTSQLRQQIEASLQRLQIDYLDAFALHGINLPEHLEWVQQEVMPVLDQLKAEGLVRHIGFSTHGSLALIIQAIQSGLFEFVNLHYYYFNQHNSPALEAALDRDMGVFIISPADKGGMLYQPSDRLVDLCSPLSPLEFGYRFLLADPRIHTLSLGLEHPRELIPALQSLTDDILPSKIQTRLQNELETRLGSDLCGQCFACLPCPVEIPIPEVLRLRNLAVAYEMDAYGKYRYNMLGQAGHWFPGEKGDQCTNCGDCLPRCPYQLPIPALLQDAHDRLNQDPIRRLWD